MYPPEQRRPITILMADDDDEDRALTQDALQDARLANDAHALGAIREQRHDVYLIDCRLGERTGLDLVREGFASRPLAPVIILTGQSDYRIDLEASALGMTDYLIKNEL